MDESSLKDYRYLDAEIRWLKAHYNKQKIMLGPELLQVPFYNLPEKRTETYTQFISREIRKLAREKENIEKAVSLLPDPERSIVELYYLRGLSIVAVADRMNYCEASVTRLKKKAIDQLADL